MHEEKSETKQIHTQTHLTTLKEIEMISYIHGNGIKLRHFVSFWHRFNVWYWKRDPLSVGLSHLFISMYSPADESKKSTQKSSIFKDGHHDLSQGSTLITAFARSFNKEYSFQWAFKPFETYRQSTQPNLQSLSQYFQYTIVTLASLSVVLRRLPSLKPALGAT
jgi:hypothetical protein